MEHSINRNTREAAKSLRQLQQDQSYHFVMITRPHLYSNHYVQCLIFIYMVIDFKKSHVNDQNLFYC